MPIKMLDDRLINKIAAGEVIEKPASVVKELVENSLDADSTAIKVSISGGGLELIAVEDDGKGLNYDEIPLAFLRHATSKLSCEADLFQISSMGFRGEALPSIASVARIEIFSKAEDADGVYARLEGGQVEEIKYYPCPEGTKIVMRELFFNTPARKKFLKSPVSEGNHIYDTMVKYALARPEISFTFSNDKKTFFKTPGTGKLRDVVIAIYGSDFAGHLLDIDYASSDFSLTGLIAAPELTRMSRKQEFFFVNLRPVRSPMFYRAVDAAYSGLLLAREYPVVILSLTLPPHSIDVNVHPQKSEIRFQDEKAAFDLLHGILKDYLRQADIRPREALFSTGHGFQHGPGPTFPGQVAEAFSSSDKPRFWFQAGLNNQASGLWPEVGSNMNLSSAQSYPYPIGIGSEAGQVLEIAPGHEFRIIGQTLNSYILLEYEGSLWLIDQHAAHERIIYSHLLQTAAVSDDPTQILALPLSLELSAREIELVENHQELFLSLGFQLEILGSNDLIIRSAPALVCGVEDELLREILELLQEKQSLNLQEKATALMACKQAIKAGEVLSYREMEKLVMDLLGSADYKNCPHGRPTMVRFTHRDLDRLFKR